LLRNLDKNPLITEITHNLAGNTNEQDPRSAGLLQKTQASNKNG